MYVVIVGAGEVGSYVARILVDEGHDVAVIEIDDDLTRRLDATLNALVVHGSGVHPDALKRAGIERADLLLAVTAVDEVNLIASMTARKHGKKGLRAVARIHQSPDVAGELSLSPEDLGLDALISPEHALTVATMDALRFAGSGEMREMGHGKLVLVGMDLAADSPLVHDTLADVRNDFPGEFLVVAAQGRDGIRIPTGADRLTPDDRAFILTVPENLTELVILSGQPWHHVRRVLIVGCGSTGLALARELEEQNLAPTVIERDLERAELVASLLPRSVVLHGDGSDPELLRARIEEDRIDTVVVLLEEPEKSLLIGVFATSLGASKVIVRCDEAAYIPLANRLGVDAVISPKRAMADAILRYVRRGDVESTLLLGEHEAEVLHLKVPERPALPGLVTQPLKDLPFPKDTLVGAVIRGTEVIIGSGETVLRPGDELFVVSRPASLGKLEKLLS
jgi:trk system potassium uptake protein TrkA